ncbi:kelch-like protein 41 [Neocloeon triangulifer]|uniref:kelch-like protein 41 n=1 Tax=Neocloeon triangulifer TaxID=2078957 RepID=UPI00286ED11A|nr:kelch-like protein 41 [Neocloeon triangulifer]
MANVPSIASLSLTGNPNDDLLDLLKTGRFYDCTLRVGDRRFKCHKLILIKSSRVFERAFYNGMLAETRLGPDDDFNINDVSVEAFDIALQFLYGNAAELERNVELAPEICTFAHLWQMQQLFKAASAVSMQNLDASNVLLVLGMHIRLGHPDGLQECWEIIEKQTVHVVSSSSWENCSKEAVKKVLTRENLSIDEFDLFKALQRWGRSMNSSIEEFLTLIRFLNFEGKELLEVCAQEDNGLTSDEKLKILLAFQTENLELFPGHLCRRKDLRFKKPSELTICCNQPGPCTSKIYFPLARDFNNATIGLSVRTPPVFKGKIFLTGIHLKDLTNFVEPCPGHYKFAMSHLLNNNQYSFIQISSTFCYGSESGTIVSSFFNPPVQIQSDGLLYSFAFLGYGQQFRMEHLMNLSGIHELAITPDLRRGQQAAVIENIKGSTAFIDAFQFQIEDN